MAWVVLLSLASRQIWPQVLAVLQMRPETLVLFHSSEEGESKRPAERLRTFFARTGLLAAECIHLLRVPHDNYTQISETIASVAEARELDGGNCTMNLTGGNKLMAMAAAEWCRRAGTPCFYIERDLRVFRFQPNGTDLRPEADFRLEPHLARHLDPLELLQCQLDEAEIVSPGQDLTLSPDGQRTPAQELGPLLKRSQTDFRRLLHADVPEGEQRAGDILELATAFGILKFGVPRVRRGIRIVSRHRRSDQREEGELDLVFNWLGKLWVVDCKERRTPEDRIDRLRAEILRQTSLSRLATSLLDELTQELRDKELKTLKEDLQVVAETGGLLGQTLVVRRSALPPQAEDYARSRRLLVVLKDRLYADLERHLAPKTR